LYGGSGHPDGKFTSCGHYSTRHIPGHYSLNPHHSSGEDPLPSGEEVSHSTTWLNNIIDDVSAFQHGAAELKAVEAAENVVPVRCWFSSSLTHSWSYMACVLILHWKLFSPIRKQPNWTLPLPKFPLRSFSREKFTPRSIPSRYNAAGHHCLRDTRYKCL